MRNKTLLTILVSFLAIFCMVGTSMAANSATMNSDKPIIPKSTCGNAGNISLILDRNTIMHEGDVVRFLLDDGVTVCGNINYFLQILNNGTAVIANGATDPIQSTSNSAAGSDFLVYSNGGLVTGAITSNGATTNGSTVDVGFLVQATDGSRLINVTLAVRDQANNEVAADSTSDLTITYKADSAQDLLTFKFFDRNTSAAFFKEPVTGTPTLYDTNLNAVSDNVLCVNTSAFSGSLVHAIPESRPAQSNATYQLSFLGDYIVAQLVSAVTYKIEPACKDAICNYVPISLSVDQQNNPIPATGSFDFGSYSTGAAAASAEDRWKSSGYATPCVGDAIGNGIIVYKDGDTFDDGAQFQVTLTVRVGTTADAAKAEWNAAAVTDYWTSSNAAANCNTDQGPLTTTAAGSPDWAFSGTGANLNTQTKVTYTVTSAQSSMNAILLDLPQIDMDLTKVAAGQKVYLDVSLVKLPCGGVIKTAEICLAELVEKCPSTNTGTNYIDGIAFIGDRMLTDVLHGYLGRTNNATDITTGLFFPYAPALNDASFFTGLAITATGSNNVMLTVTITDSAGGSATYSPTTAVPAGGQLVMTLDSMIDDLVDGATPLDLSKNVSVRVAATAAP